MHTWHDTSRPASDRARALLAEMSLDEKIHQLGSFWPSPKQGDTVIEGDVAPMESALSGGLTFEDASRLGLGHITRTFGTEPVSVEDGLAALRDIQAKVVAASPHGVPAIAHEECLTGFTAYGATVYPAAIAWGATFDPALIEEMAAAIGSDMAALGVHQGLSPLLDVVRDYRWGRVEETIGEDPYLVGTLGTAYVKGLQAGGIVATLKHFVGYPASRGGRNHAPVPMGRRELEDVMLPPFEMAVREGGTGSVMNSYSDVDGVPAGASAELLTHVLRERWGFTGTVVSDYWAVLFLEMMHKVAADLADAGRLAITAGIDVELPGTGGYAHLADLVREGKLDEAIVDRAALRVLEQKAQLGLLDPDFDPAGQGTPTDLDSPRNRDLARRLAEDSIVLLANDDEILPLDGVSVAALIGPCAGDVRTFMGCYAFPNHVMGRYPGRSLGLPITPLPDALAAEFPTVEWLREEGCPIVEPDRSGIEAAVDAAREADVAIVTVGDLAGLFGQGTSGEGCDVVDLTLPGVQAELVEAVLATGTPTVLLVISGRPYALGAFAGRCAAIVQAFMPGVEGGTAIAGVLSGRINPSGRLPIAVPNHPGGQPGTYLAPRLGWFSEGVSNLDPRPLFPFGHGLSYGSFELADLSLDSAEIPVDGSVRVSVTVRNTGERAGSDVVQLYAHDEVAQVVRPLKELIGYQKVSLEPGASARVTFDVHADRFSFTGLDYARIVEPGAITLMAGRSSEDLGLRETLTLTGGVRIVPEGRVLVTPTTVTQA
ncbi:MAG TPA: glycoside hydrolase family 3 N-terminal domain-containing protein [Propionibacteriaceae bacterium]|nr:glycoside hydrolase family 3 N-terminal domain-containing protein [Propionibacteriaceae bacterium]